MTSIPYLQLLTYLLLTFKNHNSLIPVLEREKVEFTTNRKRGETCLKVESKTIFEENFSFLSYSYK